MTQKAKSDPKVGDEVERNSSGGHTTGKVVEKATSATQIKDHKVAASPENPQFIVKSAKTGVKAAHRRLKPALPVLVVSGYAEMDGLASDLPRLIKPFRNAELAASLALLVPTPAG